MSDLRPESIPGSTSTGSKRSAALFGATVAGMPVRMVRAAGHQVWDEEGREYLDWIMALGAVALGYGHSEVVTAAEAALREGIVGPLPPVREAAVAERLRSAIPWLEQVRFLKTGAEAVAAAVRLARVTTGRDVVLGCGYHGWLDWSQQAAGVPAATRSLYRELPFNQIEPGRQLIRERGAALACVVVEPVVEQAPDPGWLAMLREESRGAGAVLVFDEIKTGFRLAIGGAAERYGVRPDLVVLGKALANGLPLAVVGGTRAVMEGAERTWISSTLATEAVALAAAGAVIEVFERERVSEHLGRIGVRLFRGLEGLAARYPALVTGVVGIPEMCSLRFRDDEAGGRVARGAAEGGLLFKRSPYNFASLAHDEGAVDRTLAILDGVLGALGGQSR